MKSPGRLSGSRADQVLARGRLHAGLVIYGSLDTVSGGFLYDRMLVEHLRSCGHTVDVLALPWRRYPLHLLDNMRIGFLNRLCYAHFDLLLQDELNHPSLFLMNRFLKALTTRSSTCPVVSIVHHLRISEQHPAALRPLYRALERSYLCTADAFILNSQTTGDAVQSLVEELPPHVVARPSGSRFTGLSPGEIAQRAAREGPLRMIFLGNLIPRKGLHTLLNALARLPASAARLVVVGSLTADPAYARFITRRLADPALSGRVELTGSLPDGQVAARLAAADVLVVPSQYEGYGIVYLEGMAFGLPAIGTTSGAAHEIVTAGEDGFLIPPGDVGALAQRLERLAADRAYLQALSLAARRRFEAHPTWQDTTTCITAFLEGLL
jgi:glycosyltransferase involved in cell wall biosynthesis